jgi:hypothetical protein
MICIVSSPSDSTSGVAVPPPSVRRLARVAGLPASVSGTFGCTSTRTCPDSSTNRPACAGAECAGSTMSFATSAPKRFAPGFSQNRPASVSQPPSAVSRCRRSRRQASISRT